MCLCAQSCFFNCKIGVGLILNKGSTVDHHKDEELTCRLWIIRVFGTKQVGKLQVVNYFIVLLVINQKKPYKIHKQLIIISNFYNVIEMDNRPAVSTNNEPEVRVQG